MSSPEVDSQHVADSNDENTLTQIPSVDYHISPNTLDADPDAAMPETKKKERKETVAVARETGRSLLPFTRVQKIIKADKDIPIMARDATFLISLATEEFIKRLCQAGQRAAEKERRTTVQHKDLATVVRRADEFMFLDEIISVTTAAPPPKRVPKALANGQASRLAAGPMLLEQFMKTSAPNDASQAPQDITTDESEATQNV